MVCKHCVGETFGFKVLFSLEEFVWFLGPGVIYPNTNDVRIPTHICGNVRCTCIDRFCQGHVLTPLKSMEEGRSKVGGGLSNSLHWSQRA